MKNIYFLRVFAQFFSLISPRTIRSLTRFYRLRRMISTLESDGSRYEITSDTKQNVIFLMSPWSGANVPFYQLYLAKLSLVNSIRTVFAHDSYALFPNMFSLFYRIFFRDSFINTSPESMDVSFGEKRQILKIVKANIIWQSRSEFFVNIVPRRCIRWFFRRQQDHFINVTKELTRQVDFIDKIIIPGGIYSVSASYVLAAKKLGILFYTYDSGADGELIFCRNGIASHMDDISDLQHDDLPAQLVEDLERQGKELMDNRAMGSDRFKFQKVSEKSVKLDEFQQKEANQKTILVPLSCPWDAASLCRQDLFQSEISFIKKVFQCYPSDQVIVRMHPVERYVYGRRNDKISEFLKAFPNCEFVSADADVNTYSLLKEVDLVICRNTTLGLEAKIRGIPVISTTKSYWNPSFSWEYVTVDKSKALSLYAMAQEHSWLFPICNLENIYKFLTHKSALPEFPEFISLISNNSTITSQKLVS